MNREQRRIMEKQLKSKGIPPDEITNIIQIKQALQSGIPSTFKEGDKVRLNAKKLISESKWDKTPNARKHFVLSHKNDVMTVEFDKQFQSNPGFVCLAEDDAEVKWLWMEDQLIKVNGVSD